MGLIFVDNYIRMTNMKNNKQQFSKRFFIMRDFISTCVSAFAAFVAVMVCMALMTFPIWGLMIFF